MIEVTKKTNVSSIILESGSYLCLAFSDIHFIHTTNFISLSYQAFINAIYHLSYYNYFIMVAYVLDDVYT